MAILLREQEQVILLKKETTYAVDAAPAGVNALLAHDIQINTLEGDVAQRNNYVGFFGNQGSVRLNQYASVKFSVELGGSGAPGTPVPYQVVYLISGHAAVITASTKVDYTPVSEAIDSATLAYYVGPVKHLITGLFGSLTWELNTSGLPRLVFNGVGLYNPATNAGAPAGVDLSAFQVPKAVNAQSVPVCTLDGTAIGMTELTINQGGQVEYFNEVNTEAAGITGRSGTVQVKFREDDPTVKNWWDKAQSNDYVALAFQRGIDVTDAGHIFEIASPRIQLKNCSRSFNKGISYLSLDGDIVPATKNSDYSFTHR